MLAKDKKKTDSSKNKVKKPFQSSKAKRDERDEKILTALNSLVKFQEELAEKTDKQSIMTASSVSRPRTASNSHSQQLVELSPFNGDSNMVLTNVDNMDTDKLVGLSVTSLVEETILTNSFKDLISKLRDKGGLKGANLQSEIVRLKKSDFLGNFISDSGATCHILCDIKLYTSFKRMNQEIHWGNASTLTIQGVGDARIKFRDTRKVKLLENCFLVPELGINILSSSKLKNHFACTFPNSILLVNIHSGEILTQGTVIKGLYYLPIEILKPSQRTVYNIQNFLNSTKELSKASLKSTAIQSLSKTKVVESQQSQTVEELRDHVTARDHMSQPMNSSNIDELNSSKIEEKRLQGELNSSLKATQNSELNSNSKTKNSELNSSSRATNSKLNSSSQATQNSEMNNSVPITDQPSRRIASQLFHKRMGHIGPKALKALAKQLNIELISNSFDFDRCAECNEAKMLQQRHKISLNANNKSLVYLEEVYSDICGPISPKTSEGMRYFITFLDKKTRFLCVTLLRHKNEALQAFQEFKARAENGAISLKRIRALQTDSGGEYLNKSFSDFNKSEGIDHRFTAPHTKEPNGLIERVNRTIMEKVRSMVYTANLPRFLWGYAVIAAAYLYNRTPHSSLNNYITPFEAKTERKPLVSHIKVFGSLCYYRDNSPKLKLDPRGQKGLLIGYAAGDANLYQIWDISKRRAIWARDVKVFEGEFLVPYDPSLSFQQELDEDLVLNEEDLEKPIARPRATDRNISSARDLSNSSNTNSNTNSNLNSQPRAHKRLAISENSQGEIARSKTDAVTIPTRSEELEIVLPKRSRRYLSKFKRFDDYYINLVSSVTDFSMHLDQEIFSWDADEKILITNLDDEPRTFKQAIKTPDSEAWMASMKEEVEELESQNTWKLVSLPPGRIALGGRWVYKLKKDSSGRIVRYKSRWVIQGFSQILGLDYLETFSTTCRPETYRLVLVYSVLMGWLIDQYDVKNAFVHALIDCELYAIQPTGFIRDSSKVCRILKALYGLKQSPRLWYQHLSKILQQFGFTPFPFDDGVFVHLQKKIIICVHVDDLLVTGAYRSLVDSIMTEISKHIKIKSLGPVSTFLGNEIEINRVKKTLFIHQTKYCKAILERFNKANLKGAEIPVNLALKLKKSAVQASIQEIRAYQQEVGSILYLGLKTRLDICFSIIKNSRYSSNPDDSHRASMDQLWEYLSRYPNLGIRFKCHSVDSFINLYSDSDWASSLEDRKSTQAFISFIGNSPISWQTRLQKTVATSSVEAEYMALKAASQEAIYLKNMVNWLVEADLIPKSSRSFATLLVDSMGAKELSENPTHHERTKHIDIAYHYIRDLVKSGDIKVIHIPDKVQLADPLTKGVPRLKFQWFLKEFGLIPWKRADKS